MTKHIFKCAACGGIFPSKRSHEETVADFEKMTGKPFDPTKVAAVCDDCLDSSKVYTCDACGGRFMSSPSWSNEHATTEYEITFGKPLDLARSTALCDDCYKLALAELMPELQRRH